MNSMAAAFRGAGRGRVIRLVALALLALIGSDLTDVACDPLGIHLDSASLTHPATPAGDSCGEVCVPDCFCCAHTLPAQAAFVIWKTETLLDPPHLPACRSVAGFAFILDHVPLSLT